MPLGVGRTMALVGILLVALNLRTAVAAISPIAHAIAVDIALDPLALSGIIGAGVARKLGLE